MSRCFFFFLRSFARKACFSAGVNSLLARRSDGFEAKTSSGARIVEVALAVGNADSSETADAFVTVEIVAFGYTKQSVTIWLV